MSRDFRDTQFTVRRRLDGSITPADKLAQVEATSVDDINNPCIGIITAVYPIDHPENTSRLIRQQYTHIFDSKEDSGYLVSTELGTPSFGPHIECDVRIVKGVSFTNREEFNVPHAPMCINFGGIDNYGFVTPQAATNITRLGDLYKSDGDWVVVQFVGGDRTQGIITNWYPHPYNTYGPTVDDKRISYFRFNGFELFLDADGNLHIDGCKAKDKITIDAHDGSTNLNKANREVEDATTDHPPGLIIIENNSNIIIEAGTGNTQGDLTLRAKTTARLRSQNASVLVDTGTKAKPVDVQTEHGGLRPAARKGDRIRISAGEDGDLFTYLKSLQDAIGQAGAFLSSGEVKAAGAILEGFVFSVIPPNEAGGKIIEGSAYCNIGGKFTSEDIGGDESGFVDEDGNQKDTSTLLADCLQATITQYTSDYIDIDGLQGQITSTLNVMALAAQVVELIPIYGEPAADAIRTAMPIVAKVLAAAQDATDLTDLVTEIDDIQKAIAAEEDPLIIADLEQQLQDKTAELTSLSEGFSIPTDPYADQVLALALAEAAISGDYSELDAITGGAFSDALEVCVDTEIEDGKV